MIMKLKIIYSVIVIFEMETTNSVSGFVKVNILDAKNHTQYSGECKKVIDKWCDCDGYLLQNNFRAWFEGIFSKLLVGGMQMAINYKQLQVKLRKSGPAFTLLIYCDERIDVDLVFTLEFKDIPPPSPFRRLQKQQPWVVVPKEVNHSHYKSFLWRISFPTPEKELLHNLHKLKLINRLVKALRDAKNLNIPSYFIKTVFLWEAHQCHLIKSNVKFWEKNLGFLFVYALYKLQCYLETGRLPYYWHKAMNLLKEYDSKNLQNMAGLLRNIIKKIDTYLEKKDFPGLENYVFSSFNFLIHGGVKIEYESRNDRNYSWVDEVINTNMVNKTSEFINNNMGNETGDENQRSCIIL